MIGGIHDSLSGLVAGQKKIVTAAHNSANANSDGFKKNRVVLQENSPSGVKASLETVKSPGPVAFEETSEGLVEVEKSNVDLGEEAVRLLEGKHLFQANLSVLRTQNSVLGTLLDIVE